MRKFLLAATAAFTLPASSFAADVPMKAQPAGAAVFDWTGFYVGGHLGDGKWRTGDFHTEAHGTHPSSWVGGLHVGQNWQVGSIVYGYEGDLSAAWFHAGPFGSGM